uniref:Serpin family A member 12 n=1 Tax=Capra hircus TaxID=9925 RepID=A0A8C2R1Z5_CAPHI
MSHRRMQLALSLVFILCGLFNSIFSEKQQHSQQHANLVLLKKISAFSQKVEAHPKAFAQELFKALIAEDPKKNIIFSPVAMTITLATLSLGIKSTMSTNHPEDLELELKLLDAHKCLHHLLHLGRELVKQKQLKHQEILFLNSKMMANQMLLHQISKLQKMDIQMIDFSDTEKAKKAISHHVAEKTHTKITDLITDLNPETILCLVNHIFFKGILKRAFQPNLTQKEDFFLNDKTKVQVDMMRKTEQMLYSRSEELFATMVKMPFKGNVSLILMLPDAGHFDNALKKLTAKRAKLQKTSNFRLVHLTLPKFKITFEINFKHLLPKINLKHLLPKIDPKHTLTTTASSQDVTLKAPLPNLERMGPAWLWLLGAGILASVHCQPFPARGDKSLRVPEAPHGQLSESFPAYQKITPTLTSFALRLYKQLAAETPGNIFFSPVSLSSTLALLSLGAQADTRTQILEGLGFNLTETPEADIHRGFQSLIHTLDLPSPKLELKLGNSLFLDMQLKPQQHILDNIRELYGVFAFSANFTNSDATRKQINGYVSRQTYGQVVDCLEEFTQDTLMVLLNYMFFKAKWKHPFNRYQTQKQESFFVDGRTSLRIPMMHQKEMHRFLYDQEVACTVLQLEYSGNAQALLILPDPGKMAQVEAALQPETLKKWDKLLLPR